MAFTFSKRSRDNLLGVNERMVQVVEYAISVTTMDFAVTEGLRSVARQEKLVAEGKSQTMRSKHIDGLAVDVAAYDDGIIWDLPAYFPIAVAFQKASNKLHIPIRWGGAWTTQNIGLYPNMHPEDMMEEYVAHKRTTGSRPFIDAVHFELA